MLLMLLFAIGQTALGFIAGMLLYSKKVRDLEAVLEAMNKANQPNP